MLRKWGVLVPIMVVALLFSPILGSALADSSQLGAPEEESASAVVNEMYTITLITGDKVLVEQFADGPLGHRH